MIDRVSRNDTASVGKSSTAHTMSGTRQEAATMASTRLAGSAARTTPADQEASLSGNGTAT